MKVYSYCSWFLLRAKRVHEESQAYTEQTIILANANQISGQAQCKCLEYQADVWFLYTHYSGRLNALEK